VSYITERFADIAGMLTMELRGKNYTDVTPYLGFLREGAWSKSHLEWNTATPVIVVPGVGSSCLGVLTQVVKFLKHYLNSEHVECIAEGNTAIAQAASSWFSGIEGLIENFRQRVLSNPIYAERGFNVIAFSQGNVVTRGYVQQYNGMSVHGRVHPTAKGWIAMNGPILGQGGIPVLDNSDWWGAAVDRAAGLACDNTALGKRITPCGYLRVPGLLSGAGYRKSLIAKMNGEDLGHHPTAQEKAEQKQFLEQSRENFKRLTSLVAVKNSGDTVIKPCGAEWLGAYSDEGVSVLKFQHTDFYKKDTFGLRSLMDAGKIHFVQTPGKFQHCIFSPGDLQAWVDRYWLWADE
jgi:palmitoyl-protein thioesterase